ncbi:hypothetical protein FRB96_006414 [Tulasnella sp. 330]|nr:hypothetical protein FRB96_006414 [Tulasnella sp. 330]
MTVRLSQTPLIGVASAAAQLVKSMSLSDLFVKPNHQNTYRRGFCNTNRNFNTNSTSRERDPTHPSLFYHPVLSSSHSPVFALSFLDKPLNEGHPRSRIIIGWVTEGTGEDGIGSGFQENPPFRELLHESIACALAAPDLDPSIAAEAVQRGEGYLHINDHRNIPAMGRIGDPDDIIGSVMVQDGKVTVNIE